eukprot:812665-Pelagomonas_calceolata.AAC.2
MRQDKQEVPNCMFGNVIHARPFGASACVAACAARKACTSCKIAQGISLPRSQALRWFAYLELLELGNCLLLDFRRRARGHHAIWVSLHGLCFERSLDGFGRDLA